ncbi:unnamed protein product [Mycena citricolor]|uniref:ATP-dependent DNA helicase II subunit 2 n=1 Tax=Mycena citricolor TaxID=2018698 RepID=A0AAD2HQ89_9AGAR|nr:unnamed protein product [Mycena citricolor]
MPAERAGYTVTMYVVDVGPSMNNLRTHDPEGNRLPHEITNLEWGLQFVKLKIQEMAGPFIIYNKRKTEQCGVILFGSDKTKNMLSKDGYERVEEYIPIAQPSGETLEQLNRLVPTEEAGDPLDALIVAIETQHKQLASKKTWTRKIVLVTDGTNPIEVTEDEASTAKRMVELGIQLTIVGIDFDDEEYPSKEEDKSNVKAENEEFYSRLVQQVTDEGGHAVLGTCALALREIARPDMKITKSTLSTTILRLGDTVTRSGEALELTIKTSKCTAVTRPKSFKKYAVRESTKRKKEAKMKVVMEEDDDATEEDTDEEEVDDTAMDVDEPAGKKVTFTQLKMRTQYLIDHRERESEDTEIKPAINPETNELEPEVEVTDKENLIRGYKYGTTYVPVTEEKDFGKLPTVKGIDICGFFPAKNFRRELSMGEIQYVWGDPNQPESQVAISSIARAMDQAGKEMMAIARWVTADERDAKMGVLFPSVNDEGADCLLWAQMPFADDVRRYTFPSLDRLVSKKGELLTEHPYLPTKSQLDAMDDFVDAMDLDAAEKDEEGNLVPWYDTRDSYNPSLHRIKQAQFHAAVVADLPNNPIGPPHPEIMKYLEPPRRVLKRAREAISSCIDEFNVKEVPKKIAKTRKDGHVHAYDDEDEMLLLGPAEPQAPQEPRTGTQTQPSKAAPKRKDPDESATEDETDNEDPETKAKADRRSTSPTVDPGRAPGRIIGDARPLDDFKSSFAGGDLVSKAVEDMCAVIKETALKPFAKRRHAELVECLTALRETCLKEDEIDVWNMFLPELKDQCLNSKPGNASFWAEVQKVGPKLSLISDEEADEHGGSSEISAFKAKKFIS